MKFFFSFQNNPKYQDLSYVLGLLRKGNTPVIAKFHMTDLVICHSNMTLTFSPIERIGNGAV